MATKSAGFKFDADTEELDRLRKDFAALANELEGIDIIEALAKHARGQIIKRTQEGKDFNHGDFPDYSEAWAGVRDREGLPSDQVNLTFSGTLLNAIDFEVLNPLEAELFVQGDIGGGNNTPRDEVAEYLQDRYSWFGLGDEDHEELEGEWVALCLNAMLQHINDARPIGSEISQLGNRPQLVLEPDPPFADYPRFR